MKKVIYIVDDDEAVRTSTQFLLEISGFECRSYASVKTFEPAFDVGAADCVLADLRMPGMGGIELATRLKKQGIIVPVIIMTGHGDEAAIQEARLAGVFGFLSKPFASDALLEMIGRALSK